MKFGFWVFSRLVTKIEKSSLIADPTQLLC